MSGELRVISLGAGVQSSTVYLLALAGELGKVDAAIFADEYLTARAEALERKAAAEQRDEAEAIDAAALHEALGTGRLTKTRSGWQIVLSMEETGELVNRLDDVE